MMLVSPAVSLAGELTLQVAEQDGYTNDHAYNNTDPVLLCGQDGFVAVLEFPLPRRLQCNSAKLCLEVSKVKKAGRVALYHLLSFNNGFAETQDYYAEARKMGEAEVTAPGPLAFDVTQAVRRDAQGPGGFSSYRLVASGAEIVLPAYESGKGKARIMTQEPNAAPGK